MRYIHLVSEQTAKEIRNAINNLTSVIAAKRGRVYNPQQFTINRTVTDLISDETARGIVSDLQALTAELAYGLEPSAYRIPTATSSALGGVKVSSTSDIEISNGFIDLNDARVVQDFLGDGLTGTTDFNVNVDGQTIDINQDGELYVTGSVSPSTLPAATSSSLGVVKPDSTTLVVDSNGVLSIGPDAGLPVQSRTYADPIFAGQSNVGLHYGYGLDVDSSGNLVANPSDFLASSGGIQLDSNGKLTLDFNNFTDEELRTLADQVSIVVDANGKLSVNSYSNLISSVTALVTWKNDLLDASQLEFGSGAYGSSSG